MLDIVGRLRAAAPTAFATLPVDVAYLYGSQVAGQPRPDSDIDVGVLLDRTVPAAEREDVASRCADALASTTSLPRIEVTVLNDAPLRFLGRVLRHRVVLYSRDEPLRVRYESLTGRMADDVEIWAAPLDAELLAAIARGHR